MNNESRQLDKVLQSAPVPAGLFDLVCRRVALAKLARARVRSVVFAVAGVLSVVGLVTAFSSVSAGFVQSGFSQYLSLLFSDAGALSSFWLDFLQSLAESLPILPLGILLGSFWVLLESIKYLFEDVPVLRRGWRF